MSLTSLNSEGYVVLRLVFVYGIFLVMNDCFQSGTEKSGNKSRLGSTSDIRNENGEIDYKKLYEQQLVENDRLKDKLRKSDEELRETKQTLERLNVVVRE